MIINYNIQNVKDPTLKAILKYEKTCNRNGTFSFREVSFKEIETEIRLLKLNKVSQHWDIPTEIRHILGKLRYIFKLHLREY